MYKTLLIVCAAGDSSRLGQPKQMLPYKGTTLLNHTLMQCTHTGHPVLVVLGSNAAIIAASIEGDFTVVVNPQWAKGMGTSISLGTRYALDHDIDNIMIVTADQPYLKASVLNRVLWRGMSNDKIVFCRYQKASGPPTFFPRRFYEALIQLDDDRGAKPIIQRYKAEALEESFEQGWIDIDEPEDLRWLDVE